MDELVLDSPLRMKALEERLSRVYGLAQVVAVAQDDFEVCNLGEIDITELLPRITTAQENSTAVIPEDPAKTQCDSGELPVLSIQHGGPYRRTAPLPKSLPEVLRNAAESSPEIGIRYLHPDGSEDFQSYPRLLADAERILAGLRKFGLEKGDKVIFQLDDNRGFISCHWACLMGGFVQVPISIAPTYLEKNLTVNKLINTWETLNFPLVITTRRLRGTLTRLADAEGLSNFRITTCEELIDNLPDEEWATSTPADVVIFLLTSGSTGKPKLVQQCHRSLISRSAGTVDFNGYTGSEVSLNWMPLDHVGGIVMWHIRDVYLACQQIHVPTQMILEKPLSWLDIIDKHRATLTWAPNFAFGLINDRLGRDPHGNWDLSSMRSMLNGGEAVVAKTARRFLSQLAPYGLPADSMQPAWGMSETCSGVTHSLRFRLETTSDDDQFVEVGAAIPGFSMRIVDDQQKLVTESVIGHLQVHGDQVTSGYYENPKANKEAFTEDGWFDTGDLGIIRDGQLAITGRGKGEIIINGVNYYSHEIESAVESIEGVEVSFTAATAVRFGKDDTDKLAIFFHPIHSEWEVQVDLVQCIRQKLVRAFGIYADYVIPVEKEAIPKTAIGKIERVRLGRQLVDGAFDDIIGRVGRIKRKGQTVPDWFIRKTWLPADGQRYDISNRQACFLIFSDTLGLGEKVSHYLRQNRRTCIQVEIGDTFDRLGDNRYSIAPDIREHYDRLLAALGEQRLVIDTIVHLWGYSAYRAVERPEGIETEQSLGFFSLVSLFQGLEQRPLFEEHLRLLVGTTHTQAVNAKEPLAFEKGTLQGFLKTVALELPWLRCRHIDFEMTGDDDVLLSDEIELADESGEIAYRQGRRFKSFLSPINMVAERPGPLPIKDGGLYLITGGLGGIGSYISQRLLQDFHSRLILVGRTQLSDGSTRSDRTADGSVPAARIANLHRIEATAHKSGGNVSYRAVDISDRSSLRTLLEEIESKWDQPIDGVFHLAGDLNTAAHWQAADRHRLSCESREAFEVFFKPKVYGTWNLLQLIEERSEAFFIGFSSVVSELGGATFGGYCAANSFLDIACRHYSTKRRQSSVYVLNWSMWKDLGMSKGNPQFAAQAALSTGNMIIEPEQGWNSLLAAICRSEPQIYIGLNRLRPKIRALLDRQPEMPKKLKLYVTTEENRLWSDALRGQIDECLKDVELPFEVFKLDGIPLLENGAVDFEALEGIARRKSTTESGRDLPGTPAEKTIAEIWREVLVVESVGRQVNFFDAGGTSIQLAQVNGRLKEAFQRNIALTDLFQYPTVASLAAFLTSSQAESPALMQSKERGEQRRGKSLRRRRSASVPVQDN